jgi:hypothetical protein
MRQSFLHFEEGPSSRSTLTKTWRVTGASDDVLGVIRWHAPWRRYWFECNGGFDVSCLREIADFIERQMEARRVNS